MRTGTYRDRDDNLVHVRRTATGYIIRRIDGGAVAAVRAESDGEVMTRDNGRPVTMRSVS